MKRAIAVGAIVLAGALVPSTALSAAQVQSEQVTAKRGAFTITFTVYTLGGKPKQVGNFEYSNADATCDTGGPVTVDGTVDGTGFGTTPNTRAKVKNHKFHKTYPGESTGGGDTKQKFTGKFVNNNNKIKGTFRLTGDFPAAPAEGCDSGKIKWVAT
jgi:hypothetical protein